MVDWWVSNILNDPSRGAPVLVSWVVIVIGSIVLHELGHGWAALRLGDTTPRDTGHMTWNPLVHMGPWSLAAFALIGIAWGAMPVDPSRLRGRHGDAWVALAGPAVNIGLGLLAAVGLALWVSYATVGDPLHANMSKFFYYAALLNFVLAIFNLMPVLPLDGGRILASLSPGYRRLAFSENGQWLMLGGFILFFWFGFEYVLMGSSLAVDAVVIGVRLVMP